MTTGVGRISTYAIFQSTLRDAASVQNELFNLQTQLSSGSKSQDFLGMADQAEQFLDLENKVSRTDLYIHNNSLVQTRVSTTSNTLAQIIDIATNIRNLVLTRRNPAFDSSSFEPQLRAQWQTLAAQLNISSEGRYLFSGTDTTVPAVNDQDFPTLAQEGTPDDGYYQGSKDDMTVRAEDGVEFVYNVRADDPAFQKIFAGLAMAKQGDTGDSDEDLGEAYALISEGLEGVVAIQATVNANKVNLDSINERHNAFKLYWQGVKETIGNTDMVSVSTQVAINQGILQATFQAFAKINSLRLSDFLR